MTELQNQKAEELAEALTAIIDVLSSEDTSGEDECCEECTEGLEEDTSFDEESPIYADRSPLSVEVFTSTNPETGDEEVVYELEDIPLKWLETGDLKILNGLFKAYQLKVQAEIIERSLND
jgi:hypothetical protein